jgi:hypothetical protein
MQVLILGAFSLVGLFYVWKGVSKNIQEIKAKSSHTLSDKLFHYPTTGIWYLYLATFFIGLTVNNL